MNMKCFRLPWCNELFLYFFVKDGLAYCEYKEGVHFIASSFEDSYPNEQIRNGKVIGPTGKKFSNRIWRDKFKSKLIKTNSVIPNIHYLKDLKMSHNYSPKSISTFVSFKLLFSEISRDDLLSDEDKSHYLYFVDNIDTNLLDFIRSVRYRLTSRYLVV
jgi:hypothetical protein